MKELRVGDARPGMVLAKPVLDRMGRILLQRGEELTQPIIDRLDAWGIATLGIETTEAKEGGSAHDPLSESQILAAIESRLDHQFERHGDLRRMKALKESAKRALLKRNPKK